MSTFRRLMKPHAPHEKRMSVETNGASGDVPAAVGKKKIIKKLLITGTPLTPRRVFCPFRETKWLMHCSMKY